jgi:hypothetical protein
MIGKSTLWGVMVSLTMALGTSGCGKSGSTGDGAEKFSGAQREAAEAALAEVSQHWVQGPEGWTTARTSGSPYAPDHYLRQVREIGVQGVRSHDLSESDKMNGFEWAGEVTFKTAPCREAGDPGILLEGMSNLGASVNRQRGQWSQWVDFQPEAIRVQKVKGKWQIQQDTWLLRGELPKPADFSNAGMQ